MAHTQQKLTQVPPPGFKDFVRVTRAELKEFFLRFSRLSVFPWCRERPQIAMLWVEWFGWLKRCETGIRIFVIFVL